jgi:hypothetical protein
VAAIRAADSAELTRQTDSLRLFRYLTLSRLYHLRASQLAAVMRVAPSPALSADLEVCLRADLCNARDLLDLVISGGYQGFDMPAFEKTVAHMAAELERYAHGPAEWVQIHLTDLAIVQGDHRT